MPAYRRKKTSLLSRIVVADKAKPCPRCEAPMYSKNGYWRCGACGLEMK
jgi:uncharacterized Zn finger protein (UPF0148 family)